MSRFELDDLLRCRKTIDGLDLRLVEILNQRTTIVEEIGRIKRDLSVPIYEPKREDEVFANILAHNPGPLSSDALKRIFERIIDEMRNVQRLKILEGDSSR